MKWDNIKVVINGKTVEGIVSVEYKPEKQLGTLEFRKEFIKQLKQQGFEPTFGEDGYIVSHRFKPNSVINIDATPYTFESVLLSIKRDEWIDK